MSSLAKDRNKERHVYLIRASGYYKIGIASNLSNRLSSIQTGNPVQIELIDQFYSLRAVDEERRIHRYLSDYSIRGEWFNIPDKKIEERAYWFFPEFPPVGGDTEDEYIRRLKVAIHIPGDGMKKPFNVKVCSVEGRLKLRWRFAQERYGLCVGLPDTPMNRRIADSLATMIGLDIVSRNFDSTLSKYREKRTWL